MLNIHEFVELDGILKIADWNFMNSFMAKIDKKQKTPIYFIILQTNFLSIHNSLQQIKETVIYLPSLVKNDNAYNQI